MAMVWTERGEIRPYKHRPARPNSCHFCRLGRAQSGFCEHESDRRHYECWSLTFVVTVTVSGISQR